ncbi:unnamed protein product [Caenorhabditis sp. 36 PRJEB53466]|nr:unnamed protein product [Caenorhabditis sp. 36 PRJEB53466]
MALTPAAAKEFVSHKHESKAKAPLPTKGVKAAVRSFVSTLPSKSSAKPPPTASSPSAKPPIKSVVVRPSRHLTMTTQKLIEKAGQKVEKRKRLREERERKDAEQKHQQTLKDLKNKADAVRKEIAEAESKRNHNRNRKRRPRSEAQTIIESDRPSERKRPWTPAPYQDSPPDWMQYMTLAQQRVMTLQNQVLLQQRQITMMQQAGMSLFPFGIVTKAMLPPPPPTI